jgi:hypothetical protein
VNLDARPEGASSGSTITDKDSPISQWFRKQRYVAELTNQRQEFRLSVNESAICPLFDDLLGMFQDK